jgi:hypothetical protein
MLNPNHLREVAARMFALSMAARDEDFARRLALRASDYLDQATELENAKVPNAKRDHEPA